MEIVDEETRLETIWRFIDNYFSNVERMELIVKIQESLFTQIEDDEVNYNLWK